MYVVVVMDMGVLCVGGTYGVKVLMGVGVLMVVWMLMGVGVLIDYLLTKQLWQEIMNALVTKCVFISFASAASIH